MVQVSLLMANCHIRLKEAAARGCAHPLDDVPFDPDRFVPRPVDHERCAGRAGDPRSLHKPDPGVRLVCACRLCMHSHGRQCLQLAAEGEAYNIARIASTTRSANAPASWMNLMVGRPWRRPCYLGRMWGFSSHLACECATHGGSFTCALGSWAVPCWP